MLANPPIRRVNSSDLSAFNPSTSLQDKLIPTDFNHFYTTFYTTFTLHLHNVYTTFTPPQTRFTKSDQVRLGQIWFTQRLYNVYTMFTLLFTQFLHNVYTMFTQYLHHVYTMFTQRLHNVYTNLSIFIISYYNFSCLLLPFLIKLFHPNLFLVFFFNRFF